MAISCNKIKILWVSEMHHTGFGNVNKVILDELKNYPQFEISILAVNNPYSREDMSSFIKSNYPFFANIWANEINGLMLDLFHPHSRDAVVAQLYGMYDLIKIAKIYQPDILFFLNDIIASQYLILKRYFPHTRFIGYFPIDSGGFAPKTLNELDEFDHIISVTKYGLNEIKKGINRNIPLYILYHPLPLDDFYPLYNRYHDKNIKQQLRKKWNIPSQNFTILNINKNQKRKRLDLTFDVFNRFWNKHPDSTLVLKTNIYSAGSVLDDGCNIVKFIEQKYPNMCGNIVIIDDKLSNNQLNEIYNLADVFLTTTMGEGWGLTPCEALLAGSPVLVPNNTAYIEIFDDDQKYSVDEIVVANIDQSPPKSDSHLLYASIQRKVVPEEKNEWLPVIQDSPKPCIIIHPNADNSMTVSDELRDISINNITFKTVGQFTNMINVKQFLDVFLPQTNYNIIHIIIQVGENYQFLRQVLNDHLTEFIITSSEFKVLQMELNNIIKCFLLNYPPADLDEIVTKLENIYHNPPIEKTLEKRKWFEENCNVSTITRQLVDILEKCK